MEKTEKKEYSKLGYLDASEYVRFEEFLDEYDISTQELADIEALGRKREAMATRLRKKRILRGFANKVIQAKQEQMKGKLDKFNDLKF